MTTSNSIAIRDLLDLAISSGDPGVVSFNILRKILETILKETNLHNKSIDVILPVPIAGSHPRTISDNTGLSERVTKLEDAFRLYESLPTNQEIVDASSGKSTQKRPVSDLVQSIKISGRVDALEGAVGKIASLVDDVIIQESKLELASQTVNTRVDELKTTLSQYGLPDTPGSEIATWSGLYKAIEGKQFAAPPIVLEAVKRKSDESDHSSAALALKKQRLVPDQPGAPSVQKTEAKVGTKSAVQTTLLH